MEIRDEDLSMMVCPRCKGEQTVWEPETIERGGTRHSIQCPNCSGRGVALTETGAKLYEFVRAVTRQR